MLASDYAELCNLRQEFFFSFFFFVSLGLTFFPAATSKIRSGSFLSWNSSPGDGFIWFSSWGEQTPSADAELVFVYRLIYLILPPCTFRSTLAAVRFQIYKYFINLSRLDPRRAHVLYTNADWTRLQLYVHSVPVDGSASGERRPAVPGKVEAQYGGRRMAICLTAIMVDGSCLLKVSDQGLRNKFLKGTPHQMEIDHLIGATCDLFNQPVMHTQLDRDMLVFTTTPGMYELLYRHAKILTLYLISR
jgi:hypothetical protein